MPSSRRPLLFDFGPVGPDFIGERYCAMTVVGGQLGREGYYGEDAVAVSKRARKKLFRRGELKKEGWLTG